MAPAADKDNRDMVKITSSLLGAVLFAWAANAAAATERAGPILSPKEFVDEAQGSDLFEILEARIAVVQSQDMSIREFARQMIEAHQKADEELNDAAKRSDLKPLAAHLSDDQAKMLMALQSLNGPDFDKAYARQQSLAHYRALVVEQHYAGTGSDANLKRRALSTVPVIRHHLEMAQQLQASVGG
jgi:putative membrane protein